MRQLVCLIVLLTLGVSTNFQAYAQPTFSGGFKAGLNFSNFDAPSEVDLNGQELEAYEYTTGFHIGAIFGLAFTDRFGLKGELMYNQKGAEVLYDGPSYFFFYDNSGRPDVLLGNRRSSVDVTNSYIDVPLMGYARFGRIEFEAGVSGSFLVSSVGIGSANFTGSNGQEFIISYDYNYFRDEAGLDGIVEQASTTGNFIIPEIVGAYYDRTSDERLFRGLDFGLVGGVSFFLNQGLFIGGRFYYGLSDVTREEQDISLFSVTADEMTIPRDDVDHNLSIQASIGFRF